MMGPAHSLSGAAAWLGAGAAAAAAGRPMPLPVLIAGALVCAGAALAPDLDHKSATISRAFGPLSRGLCEVIDRTSYAVYKATKTRADPRRSGGHRTLTHTGIWALFMGALISLLAATGSRWAVFGILFVYMVLAVEGLLWRAARVSSDIIVWLLGATSAWLMSDILYKPGNGSDWLFYVPDRDFLWLGLPVVLGALVHDIGDAITVSGCPILWPLPLGGKRWHPMGPPEPLRFRAGSWVEVKVLMPVFVVLGGVGGLGALGFI